MFSKLLFEDLLQSSCVEGHPAMTYLAKDFILHLEVELTQLRDALLGCKD